MASFSATYKGSPSINDKEVDNRRDRAIARALNTPPKPLKDVQRKSKKAQPKAAGSGKKKPGN